MVNRRDSGWLTVCALGVVLLAVIGFALQTLVLESSRADTAVGPTVANAVSTSEVTFCLNRPPTITLGTCATNATQNSTYSCQLNISDPDGTAAIDQVVFYSGLSLFNTTSDGTISFVPTNDDVGAHSVFFSITDNSGCVGSTANLTFTLTVININDPPELTTNLSDITLAVNTTLFPFFLVDYFTDPDGDAMNFTSTNPSGITVTIDGSSLVSFTTQSCDADGELITFEATDPFNASATSNVVTITVTCESPSTGGGSTESAGSGGGGGGADLCQNAWECDEWFACLPAGIQWQRCHDERGCAVDRYLQRMCEYTGPPPICEENWLCEPWSACALNGTQERICTDLVACQSTILLPPLTQECEYLATCFDGTQNGDETAVDCGGSCGACPVTESPVSIGALARWILLLLVLAALIGAGVSGYYRGEIARAAAALGFLLRHRVTKDILLTAVERRSLFERLLSLEDRTRADTMTPAARYDALAQIMRAYLADALALPIEALEMEVRERVKALSLRSETVLLIDGLLGKLTIIESEELEDDALFFQASIEEVRTAVCLTSEYAFTEIDRPLTEHPITDGMSFYDEIFARMIGILRAIQHNEVEQARAEYLQMVARYEALEAKDQEQIYPELRWLFDVTRLASEAVGGRIVDKTKFTGET